VNYKPQVWTKQKGRTFRPAGIKVNIIGTVCQGVDIRADIASLLFTRTGGGIFFNRRSGGGVGLIFLHQFGKVLTKFENAV
jgi:hypothetical protein